MIRTRFAPSPTGYLHIGGARTALFAWAFARKHQGQFILRIEDTDTERSTAESTQAILDGMAWLGLTPDEGPFYQSDRIEHYQNIAEELIRAGKAYRCQCSKERLEKLRNDQLENKQKPRYDGRCRDLNLSADTPNCVIRFRNPDTGTVTFSDLVHGELSYQNQELDDLVIVRSDGIPTYNFCVVIDDSEMQITHVIRGDDHINNTPRQLNIFAALNAKAPLYAHVPMILGADGKRLSKRHGAVSVMQYREDGFLPHALLNYLIRLGWSHGDQEIFSRDEIINLFDLNHINKAPASFNPEKLLWLNQHYLKSMPPELLVEEAQWHFEQNKIDTKSETDLISVIKLQAERVKTLKELAERSRYFYEPVTEYDAAAVKKNITDDVIPVLKELTAELEHLTTWKAESIHSVLVNLSEKSGLKLGKIAQPIRIAITGGTVSPPIDGTLEVLGKKIVLQRLVSFLVSAVRP